jgi:hypothetical protein
MHSIQELNKCVTRIYIKTQYITHTNMSTRGDVMVFYTVIMAVAELLMNEMCGFLVLG